MKSKNNWSPVLTVLLLAIASFAFILPKEVEEKSSEEILQTILNQDVFVDLNGIDATTFQIVDLRNSTAFEIGHLPNAKNIYSANVLAKEHLEFFKTMENENTVVLLTAESSAQVLPAYKMLFQYGFDNLKIGTVTQVVEHNKFKIENEPLNTPPPNIQEFIDSSVKRAQILKENQTPVVKKSKQIIPKKKKKKLPVEGGC